MTLHQFVFLLLVIVEKRRNIIGDETIRSWADELPNLSQTPRRSHFSEYWSLHWRGLDGTWLVTTTAWPAGRKINASTTILRRTTPLPWQRRILFADVDGLHQAKCKRNGIVSSKERSAGVWSESVINFELKALSWRAAFLSRNAMPRQHVKAVPFQWRVTPLSYTPSHKLFFISFSFIRQLFVWYFA